MEKRLQYSIGIERKEKSPGRKGGERRKEGVRSRAGVKGGEETIGQAAAPADWTEAACFCDAFGPATFSRGPQLFLWRLHSVTPVI
jgi:hypothetical protein